MSDDTIIVDMRGLEQAIKMFKNVPSVKVGVLANKDNRIITDTTNAIIGAKHEFGSPGNPSKGIKPTPQRSFLRTPISDNLENYLEESGGNNPEIFQLVMRLGSLKPIIEKLGALCVQIVDDAFDSGGFGKWKPSNMAFKKVHMTLVETQQLKNSIGFEVTNG